MIQRRQHHSGLQLTSIVLTLLSIVGFCPEGAHAHGALLRDDQSQSTEQSPQWKSRRAPGKWVPVSGMADQPVSTGTATDKTAKPTLGTSVPSIASRKTSPMVFIAGKSAQETQSNDDLSHSSSDEHGHLDKSPAKPDTSHPEDAAKHDAAVQHDGPDHTSNSEQADLQPHNHAEQPAAHAPMYFDAPALDSPDSHADESSDGAPIVSSTEQVKQMLQRHAELETSPELGQSSQKKEVLDAGEKRTISALPSSIEADLRSEDPIRREQAKRFLKLREQLLQLKARAKPSTPAAATNTQGGPAKNGATHENSGDAHGELTHSRPKQTTPASDHAEHPATDAGHSDAGHDEADHGDAHGDSHQPTKAETHAVDTHSERAASSHEPASHAPASHDSGEHAPAEHGAADHGAADHGADSAETHDEIQDGHETLAPNDAHLTAGSISDPIDRVSLGNNLYALGEYPAAHKAYLSVNPEELTSEQQFWTEYQIANCLRRMGENAEASNRFRKIAGQPEAGWLSERAAWWVGVLEQMRRAETALTPEAAPNPSTSTTKTSLPISRSPKEESHDNAHH
jgi:hypothetical protein